ncbi:MAG: hypothetical protein C4K49_02360 [Candidatus Thorarchaeota archaeon]|nr:MAG: hypothetical protein C4K49_02360 [Candidatus Thorarchaeota archaeon]
MGLAAGMRFLSLLFIAAIVTGSFAATTGVPFTSAVANDMKKMESGSVHSYEKLDPMATEQELGADTDSPTDLIFDTLEKDQSSEKNSADSLYDSGDFYADYRMETKHPTTEFYGVYGEGMNIDFVVEGDRLLVQVTVGSYDVSTYSIGSNAYQIVAIGDTELTHEYGRPVTPYAKQMLSLPTGATIITSNIVNEIRFPINNLALMPGPKPLSVSEGVPAIETLFFDPGAYSSSVYQPAHVADYEIVRINGIPCISLQLCPLQYNPTEKAASLLLQFVLEITFSRNVHLSEFQVPTGLEPLSFGSGEGYLIVTPDDYIPYLDEFANWKSFLGFNVYVASVEDIVAAFPGRDAPERLRNCIIEQHTANNIEYVLLLGDGDVVPAREVWDPAYAGAGIDNGTEASDLYFECLDGNWDANDNDLFGEVEDQVDFYPEVMVGRIPVQTPDDASHVLHAIVKLESDPEPGDWMDDFLLLGPNCFVSGDGAAMTEAELNQPYLIGSFFDMYRLYPTDGSLSDSNVIDRINQGVGIIDFFDHGAYDVWVDSLTIPETLSLSNGFRTPFAFAMACETGAFDYEIGEPTIAEAFFRNANGGAAAYIGATRIAWAGYYAFDGLHNRFWDYFFDTALSQYSASPKIALRDAVNEMVMTYDMADSISRETVIQAIYFGDPSMQLYWKNEVEVTSTPVDINQEAVIEVNCTTFNHLPVTSMVNVTIEDPLGNPVVDGGFSPDPTGHFTVYHNATQHPGTYTAHFAFTEPFEYMAERTYQIGLGNVSVVLDTSPVYGAPLAFSGFSDMDGNGTAYLVNQNGGVITSSGFEVIGGTYSGAINITSFGAQTLHIEVVSATESGGSSHVSFEVMRGQILIIADESGGYGPWYPGGWVDENAGDSTDFGDIYQALKDEYYVDVFRPRYELVPDLAFLELFDAVIVTVGDHYGMPLIAPDSYLLDVLMEYHNASGNLLFEGGSILTPLEASYGAIFPTFFHVELQQRLDNTGGLYLENAPHPITSGLPASLWLDDGLGSPFAEVIAPASGSAHVSGYSGEYEGGTAIAALNPTATNGGVVFFGFSVDAIVDVSDRNTLLKNAVDFLLYPSLTCSLSDNALLTGGTEVVEVIVTDSATGAPVGAALVDVFGCGVSTENHTLPDGTCTITIHPTVPGYILVNITKADYLPFETNIVSYETPVIGLEIMPEFLERDTTSNVSISCFDFYEGYPLDNVSIVLDGCGVYETGISDQFGFIEFTVHPVSSGRIQINATHAGYADAHEFLGVRLIAAVVRGLFTESPDMACWDRINANWEAYGQTPIFIDYVSLNIPLITLADVEALGPDVLIMSYMYQPLGSSELQAVLDYTREGHGLVVTSSCVSYHPDVLGAFLGLDGTLGWTSNSAIGIDFESLDLLEPEHPIFEGVSNPYPVGYPLSYLPLGIRWDSAALVGASMVALDSSQERVAAVITYRGLVYASNIPEYQSNAQDLQLVYNMISWSSYEIPEHDLGVSLDVPRTADPGEEVLINADVMNLGLNTEYNVTYGIYIEGAGVANGTIPVLENNTSYSVLYPWTPLNEGLYVIEALVDPVAGEDTLANNYIQQSVNVFELELDGPVAIFQDQDPWGLGSIREVLDLWMVPYVLYDDTAMGTVDLSVYQKVVIASAQPSWFMDALYMNIAWFEDYVAQGGVLEINAATNSYWIDGLVPGGSYYVQAPSDYVSIIDPYHPTMLIPNIITDEELDNWYSSVHGYLDPLASGASVILATDYGNPVLVEQPFGLGSIMISTQTLEWGFGAGYSRVLENILLYLPAVPEHDLAAILELESSVSPGEWTLVTATAINRGLNSETNVTLHLYIDEVEVMSTYVPLLESRNSVTIRDWWMSDIEGNHDVRAYVEPVPDEEDTANNLAVSVLVVAEFHDYYMSEYEPVWLDAKANGFNIGLSGDDVSIGLGLPFTFSYYDQMFDVVYISSNGWLSFYNTNPYQPYSPSWPTSDSAYRYSLALLLADLLAESNVFVWATEDWVVIQYDNYRHLSGMTMGTFEVVLYKSGLIQFNYLEMFDVDPYGVPVVGLNYGDGIYGPVYPGGDLSGVIDFGLMFTYVLPEHELAIMLKVPSYVSPGTSLYVDAEVSNFGLSDEYNVNVSIYLDGGLVANAIIPYLPTLSQYTLSYYWDQPSEGVYYFDAMVDPVENETNLDNNFASRMVTVQNLLVITSPMEGEVIEGGQVLIAYEAANPESLTGIDVIVNGEYIANASNIGLNQFIVPVFREGTNEIALIAWWNGNLSAIAVVNIESTNVTPLAELEPSDYLNYLFTYSGGYYQEYNFTFGNYVSEFEVEVGLLLHVWDDSGYENIAYYNLIVNVLNGYIAWSDIGWDNYHFFPFTGLLSPEVISHASPGDLATFFTWNDLYVISDLGEWRGRTVWNGYGLLGDFSCSVLESNGLLVEMYFGLPTPYCYAEVMDTNLISGFVENEIVIVQPAMEEVVEGGLVYVEFTGSNLGSLLQIEAFVNDESLFIIPYNGSNSLFVPVFANGTNTISVAATWSDASSSSANVTVLSADVIPIARPKSGDYLNLRIEDPYATNDLNLTFGEMVAEFEVQASLIYHLYNEGGTIALENYTLTINILNGYIPQSDFYWETFHFMFFTGLPSPNPIQSYTQIGDLAPFFMWQQILSVVGPAEWNGEAVWVLSSESGDISALCLQSNGLLVQFNSTDMMVRGFGYLTDTNMIPPFDNVPPAWVSLPEDQYLVVGDSLYYDLDAIDPAGVGDWWIDDTVHFAIDSEGVVTNVVELGGGIYPIQVWVSDTLGNVLTGSFRVIVEVISGPILIDGDGDFVSQHWPGLGTPEDPFIVSGLVLNASGLYVPCIEIRNTQAFFIVQHCAMYAAGGYSALYLYNVENGVIEDNTCTGGSFGILMEICRLTTVVDNLCFRNDFGICAISTSYCYFQSNDCFENSVGIMLADTYLSSVIDNQCSMNEIFGISLNGTCSLINVTDNYCEGNYFGIYETFSGNSTLLNNTCIGNTIGMELDYSYGDYVCFNSILYNQGYGLVLVEAADTIVHENTIVGNQGTGILVLWGTMNEISDNYLAQDVQGIIIDTSTSNHISWNTIEDCLDVGIVLSQSEWNTIEYNVISNNDAGLYFLQYSDNNIVMWNVFEDNTQYNMADDYENNLVDYNYWSDYTGPDDDHDGYGDIPYHIFGFAENEDPHPLMYYPWYLSWIETPGNMTIGGGEALSYDLQVFGYGNLTYTLISDGMFWIDDQGVLRNATPLETGDYHISIVVSNLWEYTISAEFTITVEDTMPPEWIEVPTDQIIEFGELLVYDLNATDYSGIAYYWVNDTTSFNIDSMGILTNALSLTVGRYGIEIRAYDPQGYFCGAIITVNVVDSTPPIWTIEPEDQVLEAGEDLDYQVEAWDLSGEVSYSVLPDGLFAVSASGLISNLHTLEVGAYAIAVQVSDIYGNTITATFTLTVTDTTPPEWLELPVDRSVLQGQPLEYPIAVADASAISWWAINDTAHFRIDPMGDVAHGVAVIINSTDLEPGVYGLEITVSDAFGNVQSATITITVIHVTVTDTTPPEWLETPLDRSVLQSQPFEYAVAVTDASAISWWAINDTANFRIDPMGDVAHGVAVITNSTDLEPGVYGLEITVSDAFGNVQSATITITVIQATVIISPAIGIVVIVSGAACVIVIIIVIATRGRRP